MFSGETSRFYITELKFDRGDFECDTSIPESDACYKDLPFTNFKPIARNARIQDISD